jgi:glyoxylase-like metal-dependent hydrolase (beta-lactamase superfamily II)
MTKRSVLFMGFGLAFAVALVRAQPFGQEAAKLDTVKLADDLYVIHNDFVPGNTTVLITTAGVILVDDKYEIDHANIMASLKKITTQPVRFVINTHYHGDHSGGNAKLQALGARAVSSEKAHERMVAGKQSGLAELTFDQHMHVRLGGKQVDLYYFGRSHTDGDIVALFPQHKVLAAGDMFAYGDRTPELIDYAGGGSAKEWPATLDKALALPFDRVVPGHGVVTTRAEMKKFRDSTQALFSRVHTMNTEKKSKADIEKMLRTDYKWADLHVQMGLDGVIAEAK